MGAGKEEERPSQGAQGPDGWMDGRRVSRPGLPRLPGGPPLGAAPTAYHREACELDARPRASGEPGRGRRLVHGKRTAGNVPCSARPELLADPCFPFPPLLLPPPRPELRASRPLGAQGGRSVPSRRHPAGGFGGRPALPPCSIRRPPAWSHLRPSPHNGNGPRGQPRSKQPVVCVRGTPRWAGRAGWRARGPRDRLRPRWWQSGFMAAGDNGRM